MKEILQKFVKESPLKIAKNFVYGPISRTSRSCKQIIDKNSVVAINGDSKIKMLEIPHKFVKESPLKIAKIFVYGPISMRKIQHTPTFG